MKKEQKPVRREINSKLLKSDLDYQRAVDMKRVNNIVEDYDERLIGTFTVSYRGGCFYIVDGQHRYEALKIINQGKDFKVECLVFQGLSKKEEALLFAKQNKCAKALTRRDELKALFTGSDEETMKIMRLVSEAGLEVSFKSKGNSNNKIEAVVKLEKIYRNMDNEDFVRMLTVIKKSWNGAKDSLVGEILGGMYVFYKTYGGQFDEDKLIKKLSAVSPQSIVRDGKAFTLKGDYKFTLVIVKIYNHKNRSKLNEALLSFRL